MTSDYYLRVHGNIKGPIRHAQIVGLIRKKRLGRHHEISRDSINWARVGEIPEFTAYWSSPATATKASAQEESPHSESEANASGVTPSNEDWYYASESEYFGPVSTSQMLTFLQSGVISGDTLVWKSDFEDWREARSALQRPDGSRPLKSPPAPPRPQRQGNGVFCTNCGEAVSPKAIACIHCGVPPRAEKRFCYNCGVAVNVNQVMCVECGSGLAPRSAGTDQRMPVGDRNKSTAGILALLAGGLGAHKFYHGSWGWGLIYLVSIFTFVPAILAFFEGLHYLMMDTSTYEQRYNRSAPTAFKW